LIFYVHGGGFVAQTSATGEFYLSEITRQLDVPIAAIDYTVALDAPFPRAIDETFYAYCWILKHPEYFGSTLDRIVFIGDSAGSSLAKACAIKCIQNNVRLPDRIVNAYGVTEVSWVMSPSRFASLADPILPFTMITKLLIAYVTSKEQKAENEMKKLREFDAEIPNDILLTPIRASDEMLMKFPSMSFVCPTLDPCLDENLEFAKRLNRLGVSVSVRILENLSHAFLNFAHVSDDCRRGMTIFIEEIQKSIL
jgi:acetyl esterase/lipase